MFLHVKRAKASACLAASKQVFYPAAIDGVPAILVSGLANQKERTSGGFSLYFLAVKLRERLFFSSGWPGRQKLTTLADVGRTMTKAQG